MHLVLLQALAQAPAELQLEGMTATGQFNVWALIGVAVAVFLLSALLWLLQLAISKVLVFVVPVLAGIGAAFFVPVGTDVATIAVTSLPFVLLGVSLSLVFLLYATIFDLKRKTAELEERLSGPGPRSREVGEPPAGEEW